MSVVTETAPGSERTGRHAWVWWIANAAFVTLCWAVALVVDREFFYFDDSPGGALGQWYELGQHLWAGQIPFLNVEGWMAGNYTMEQWGLLSLPTWVVALLAPFASDLLVFTSLVKLAHLLIGALGVQYLARVVGVDKAWAAIAGASAAVAGFTFFMDATTWVTQLMVWAWFGWAFGGLIRWSTQRRGLLLALLAGYCVITVGYVHGTLFLVMAFVALLVDGLLRRDGGRIVRVLVAGVVLGLVALANYLPAVVGSPLTVRADTIDNDGFMTLTMNGLFVSAAPMASPDLTGWWGRYAHAPYTYIAWFLPLLVLVPFRTVVRVVRTNVPLAVFGLLALALALGPSQLAMFRYPVRAMPWIATTVLVLAAAALSTVDGTRQARGRAGAAAVLAGLGYYLAWAGFPEQARWLVPLGLVVTAAVWVVARAASGRGPEFLRRVGLAGLVALVSVPLVLTQVVGVARRDPGFGRTGFPSDLATLQTVLVGGRGNAVVVGDPWLAGPGVLWNETLSGNLWYLVDDADVMNLYSPSGFTAFNHDLCMNTYYGITCQDLLARLFAEDPTTGALLVDLLSVDTIQVVADHERTVAEVMALRPPDGWAEVHRGSASVIWVREGPVVAATNDAWASAGLVGEVVAGDDMSFTFRVDAVPPGGGTLVLPRLAWPGYRVEGGTLGEPLRGYLLTVDVAGGTLPGSLVAVSYEPPGQAIQVGALAGAGLLALVLLVWEAVRRRRGVAIGDIPGAEPSG